MGIVTIGGGTGTAVVNEALLLAGVKKITSIVTVMDSGGITGRMRTDSQGQEVAYSDGLRTLLSLIPPKALNSPKVKILKSLLRRRNDRGQDLGYTIFSHFFDQKSGFGPVQEILEKLTQIKFAGVVLPITTQSSNLMFTTASGRTYQGEHELDDKRMSADVVSRVWLEPQAAGYPKALETIIDARLLIFSCGSLYGSAIANLLPTGVKQALKISKAVKVLVTNLASTRNETHNFAPLDFIRIFQKYTLLENPLDVLVVPDLSRADFEKKYPRIARRYALDNSYFLGWDQKLLDNVVILPHNATTIDPVQKRLRHDPRKLALTLKKLLAIK